MSNFIQLYKNGCKMRNENTVLIELYRDLDKLLNYINNHVNKTKYENALSDKRIVITLPYMISPYYQYLPHDGVTKEGIKYSLVSFSTMKYRLDLINHMDNSYGIELFGNHKILNSWKLLRLEKVINMGWNLFAENYLKTLP